MKEVIKRLANIRTYILLGRLFKIILASIIAKIIYKKKKYRNIWLIAERSNEARDNGYHLFKYIRENFPNMNVYYVIEKNCYDFGKVEVLGNVIEYRSWKHYFYYAMCSKLVSTHLYESSPEPRWCTQVRKILPVNQKICFLQHGVTKDYIEGLSANKAEIDLFVSGALPEYEFITSDFGHINEKVQYLGFPRFDMLHELKTENYILLMPTFRKWLQFEGIKIGEKEEKDFLKSNYYRRYQSLLNNKELYKMLKENNSKLIFYPHFEVQKFIHLFQENDQVVIADKEHYDVQQLLINSKVLITDFSSVYFDFAYMKKPLSYYHFDYNQYREGHYSKGYFDYELDGFGPVIKDEDELVNWIINTYEKNCTLEDKYSDRISAFFPLYDKNNTKRNFEAINNLN